jgi:hypothetical protein
MTKPNRILTLLMGLAAVFQVSAETHPGARFATNGLTNGNAWIEAFDESQRLFFVTGLLEGPTMVCVSTSTSSASDPCQGWQAMVGMVNPADLTKELDRIYRDIANRRIPVVLLTVIAAQRLIGNLGDEEASALIQSLRKQASGSQQ